MKSATSQMIAILGPNGTRNLSAANCYEITLVDGTILRYTTWPSALKLGANTYLSGPPNITSSSVKQSVGVEITTMKMTIADSTSGVTIEGLTILQAVRAGLFAKATVKVYRVYMSAPPDTTPGSLTWFIGRISTIDALDAIKAEVTVRSMLEVLENQLPKQLLMPSCTNTLFDAGCTLSAAAFKVSSAAIAGSTQNKILTSLGQPADYFDQGYIQFTSGGNNGAIRSVRLFSGGALFLATKLNNVVNAGDTFDVYPGCDKKQATCTTKFSNLIHFNGEPYIPNPETAI